MKQNPLSCFCLDSLHVGASLLRLARPLPSGFSFVSSPFTLKLPSADGCSLLLGFGNIMAYLFCCSHLV